jgi:hypothetical protein
MGSRALSGWERWNGGRMRRKPNPPITTCEYITECREKFPKWYKECKKEDFKKKVCTIRHELKLIEE